MKPSFAVRAATIAVLILSAAVSRSWAQNVYHPIPIGFDFPADPAALLKLRDDGNVSGMRKHAWMLFAGLTQPTETGEAIWETWYTATQTFRSGAELQGEHRLVRKFQNPRQFMSPGPHPQAIGASLLSFTLFNADVRKHVRTNNYNSRAHLTELNNAFGPSIPSADRHIADFPNSAVSLKTVWWIVKKSGLTATPVWDPELNPQIANGNDYPTWKRVVAVDPSRDEIPAGETATVNLLGRSFAGSSVVPLAHFYHFQISQSEIDSVHASPAPNAQDAEIGDYAVLVLLHCTTKEIPQWVWATFWWHDKPDAGAFAADRPAAVTGPWRNYLMNTTYSMDQPKEPDGSPPICFNPWLEARFRNGVKSNCMACHQKAVWPTDGNFTPITRGSLQPADPIFVNKMKLDFLWSVAFEGQ
ncbi:hypothetical protein [Candidatus Binatus sp.]|uniref:hypothetical protein n=1 Tax=Candidatus Binatus sp. TaxID=2811406 RepID=UPI003C852DBE